MGPHQKYSQWTADELKDLERWDWERTHYYTFKGKALMLGVSQAVLEWAVWRARAMFRNKRVNAGVLERRDAAPAAGAQSS